MVFQVSITGGKGGTGKSFIATGLALILSRERNVVLGDLDVEAPNDHIILGVNELLEEQPIAVFFPLIDYKRCILCGNCSRVCDTSAILFGKDRPPLTIPRLCSGCQACYYACPVNAIREGARVIGYTYKTPVKVDGDKTLILVTGVLREGEEHVAPAVIAAKKRALGVARDLLLIDTGAGAGSSVATALRGSKLVIVVTEPTPLGLHDLKVILKVIEALNVRWWLVVNRQGIGDPSEHKKVARAYGAEHIFYIPYSRGVVEAYSKGTHVIQLYPNDPASKALAEIAEQLL